MCFGDHADGQLLMIFSCIKDMSTDFTNGFRSLCEITSPSDDHFNESLAKSTESFLAACANFEQTKSFSK